MSNFNNANGERLNSFTGELRLLAEKKGQKQKVELWLLNEKTNRNNWRYENLEQHRALFAETPILVAYVGKEIGDGHNFEKVEKDGEVYASFLSSTAERIVGFFQSETDIRIEEKDGANWIVGQGWIWKWYAQELVRKLKKQGLEGMKISIETLIDEMYRDGSTEVFTKYQILGTTILGDNVTEAVAGANIKVLSALGVETIREETLRVASAQEQTKKNPQTKTNKEKQTIMNKKSLKDNFKGFNIIDVVGEKVALLSHDKHEAYVSSVTKDERGIVEGAKVNVNAAVVFGEGEDAVKVALDSIIDIFKAENDDLKNQVADKDTTIKVLSEANEKMKNQEIERRKESVKNAIDNRFNEIKANSEVDFGADKCAELKTEERINSFIAMEDKDGKFIGEKEAVKAVDALCMDAIIESNKVKANAQKKKCVWDEANADKEKGRSGDDIDNLVAAFSGNE